MKIPDNELLFIKVKPFFDFSAKNFKTRIDKEEFINTEKVHNFSIFQNFRKLIL